MLKLVDKFILLSFYSGRICAKLPMYIFVVFISIARRTWAPQLPFWIVLQTRVVVAWKCLGWRFISWSTNLFIGRIACCMRNMAEGFYERFSHGPEVLDQHPPCAPSAGTVLWVIASLLFPVACKCSEFATTQFVIDVLILRSVRCWDVLYISINFSILFSWLYYCRYWLDERGDTLKRLAWWRITCRYELFSLSLGAAASGDAYGDFGGLWVFAVCCCW